MHETRTGMPFRSSWTRLDAAAWIAGEGLGRAETNAAAHARYTALEKAFLGHLQHLAADGRLALPEQSQFVQGSWLDSYRALIASHGQEASPRLVEPLGMALVLQVSRLLHRLPAGEAMSPQALHAAVCGYIEAGTFDHDMAEGFVDQRSGERLLPVFAGWKCQLFARRAGRLQPMPAPWQPTVCHVEIPVPSGELMLADWFRIDAFTHATRAIDEQAATAGAPGIDSEKGRAAHTLAYARSLGFLSVYSGNSSPAILSIDGRILIAETGEGKPPGHSLGSICTDLWWSTLIDRSILQDILGKALPPERAAIAMQEMTRCRDVTCVKVPPGTWHAYFSGTPETFQDLFRADGVEAPGCTLHCVLSPTPLTLRPPAPAPATRRPHP